MKKLAIIVLVFFFNTLRSMENTDESKNTFNGYTGLMTNNYLTAAHQSGVFQVSETIKNEKLPSHLSSLQINLDKKPLQENDKLRNALSDILIDILRNKSCIEIAPLIQAITIEKEKLPSHLSLVQITLNEQILDENDALKNALSRIVIDIVSSKSCIEIAPLIQAMETLRPPKLGVTRAKKIRMPQPFLKRHYFAFACATGITGCIIGWYTRPLIDRLWQTLYT